MLLLPPSTMAVVATAIAIGQMSWEDGTVLGIYLSRGVRCFSESRRRREDASVTGTADCEKRFDFVAMLLSLFAHGPTASSGMSFFLCVRVRVCGLWVIHCAVSWQRRFFILAVFGGIM